LPVLARPDAGDAGLVRAVADARFLYLVGGSAMHLRSVVKDTPLWAALLEAWEGGAVVAGSSAAAMALCDPMVDPRGGAFTLGLGLLRQLAVITEYDTWSHERARRTFELAGAGLTVVGIERRTALVHEAGAWRAAGVGDVVVHRGGDTGGIELLG
jgi:cyanophycinase